MTFEEWWDRPEGCGATPDTYKGWEKSCHAAWDASAASRDTEIESLRQQLDGWIAANSPNGWIDNLRQQLAAALAAIKVKDAFIEKVAKQMPEKPDYWSSCSQCGYNSSEAEDLLAIQPDDSALTDFLGEPVAWIDELGFLFHTVNEPDEYTPLYSPKWRTK